MPARLEFVQLRFDLQALEAVKFPPGKAGNVLRGALGTLLRQVACEPNCDDVRTCPLRSTCVYARVFEPADGPRPFVFRAAHLDGRTSDPGDFFSFGMNVFDRSETTLSYIVKTFGSLATEGLGPGRGRAALVGSQRVPCRLSLDRYQETASSIAVQFKTPTELKDGNEVVSHPHFSVMMRRIAERLNALGALYGQEPISLDERGIGERAEQVQMTECRVRHAKVSRVSTRTGQKHPLGGFVGEAVYEGELDEFLPLLRAGEFTGVGRHTAWGNGELGVRVLR